MLARLRRKQILEELRAKGGVRLTELSEELSVSEMTIRRDLDALQKDGLIERVHGGAVLAQFGTEEPGFEKKVLREHDEKAAIAERAAALVKPGSAVALSAGTTTHALASRLSTSEGLTVVTNSMNVWNELHRRRQQRHDGDPDGWGVPHALRCSGRANGRRVDQVALFRPPVPRRSRSRPGGRLDHA